MYLRMEFSNRRAWRANGTLETLERRGWLEMSRLFESGSFLTRQGSVRTMRVRHIRGLSPDKPHQVRLRQDQGLRGNGMVWESCLKDSEQTSLSSKLDLPKTVVEGVN